MSNREALMRPFTDDEVQWRPGAAKWEHRPNCEGPKCRETKDPAKHMQLAYVEDEQVMDRLDEGFGPGYWQLLTEPVDHTVVKVRLGVCYDLEHWVWYEDFGYANREGGDVLKEAVTDGIRRCGRFVGIARDLYRKGVTTHGARVASSPAPAPRPQPVDSRPVGGEPEEPDWVRDQIAHDERTATQGDAGAGTCPDHHIGWVLQPAGVSKAGKSYDAFWKCPASGPPFCKQKPGEAWMARHEVA